MLNYYKGVKNPDLPMSKIFITSAEREVKDSRRSGMYQSYHFFDKIGHAKSVGFRFYSAI